MTTLIFRNGKVLSEAVLDGTLEQPPSALVVEDGVIAAIGQEDTAEAHLDGADRVIDLEGRLLMPGFVDAHVHAYQGGLERNACDLTSALTAEAYEDIIRRYHVDHPEGWLVGGGWAMEAFPNGLARRETLDELVGDRPAFLPNKDHHSAWVSSAALRAAGIDQGTPDPPGGRIERDPDGEPTGMLHEHAMGLVQAVMPTTTQDEYDAGLRTASEYLTSLGIVGWQEVYLKTVDAEPGPHQAYRSADAEGALHARVRAALWWDPTVPAEGIAAEVARLAEIREETNRAGGRYGINAVKIMQDGVAETYTAAMLEPYLGEDGAPTANTGISFLEPELLTKVVAALDAAGFQIHLHALGDRAVRDCLDALEAARAAHGDRDLRHHLVHLQFVDPDDVPRFAELRATANIQALWAVHDPQTDALTAPYVGEERAERMYPFGELLRTGAPLAMGSDWPVSTPDPLAAIHVAVNRRAVGADQSVRPLGSSQDIPLLTALKAYTAGSAWLNRAEETTGSLRVGAAADLIVLDRDLLTVPPEEIGQAVVDHTFIEGVEVYARER
ncbi:amidohydrolase [Demequina zhanjiangensis]|uniref:Amidohydrolase n=1 Tax=Demequina zhanjiangensis TaxID=3051659 RepID=A0ABT8G0A1_9MICO|nr:amidohydrolase [Demequina sp. SYSU T00b26]MDN4472565.1 amidohydrolase [Demequina sp. SYSU T00b26]